MTRSHPVSVRLTADARQHPREIARGAGRPLGQVISALVEEGVRMRRSPGIIFTDGPTGRRAAVPGTGVDVWQVVRVWKTCEDRRRGPQDRRRG